MEQPNQFRASFNGFNREDVVRYMEYINSKHAAQVAQLTNELEYLRGKQETLDADRVSQLERDLGTAQTENESLKEQNEALNRKNETLTQQNAEAKEENERLKARIAELEQKMESQPHLRNELCTRLRMIIYSCSGIHRKPCSNILTKIYITCYFIQ
mgnify:CR=1 FL=1